MKFTLFLMCLCCFACKSSTTADGRFQDIAVSDLAKEIKKYPNSVILDVRTPEEVEEGNVKGSINVDYKADNFEVELKKLDRDKVYFVYCRSGRRSSNALKKMQELGFTKAYNVLGGYNAISDPTNN